MPADLREHGKRERCQKNESQLAHLALRRSPRNREGDQAGVGKQKDWENKVWAVAALIKNDDAAKGQRSRRAEQASTNSNRRQPLNRTRQKPTHRVFPL